MGISCALNLLEKILEKNIEVILIEKNLKTEETSFGNAGVIARSSAYLINNKNLVPSLKNYVFNKHPAVRLDYLYLAKNICWSSQFLFQSLKEKSERNIQHLDSLIEISLDEHKKWLALSGQSHRLRENGFLKLYRKAESLQATGYEQAIYKRLNIDFEMINASILKEREPALNAIYAGAVKDAAPVDNPGEVVDGYRDLFLAMGGKIVHDTITRLSTTPLPRNQPRLPDSLPAIGKSPQHSNLWLAFDHQHVDFSIGPATRRLIAELIANEPTQIDTMPFSPGRFA